MPLYCFCFPLRFPGAPKPSRASFFPKRGNKIRNHYQRYNKLPPPAPLFEWSASSQDPHRTGASARTEVQPRPRMTAFSLSAERMCFCGMWDGRRSLPSFRDLGHPAGKMGKGLTGPFSYSENHLESGGIRGNMLIWRFAFVPYRTNGEKL